MEYFQPIADLWDKEVSVHTSFYLSCAGLLAMQFVVDLIASYASYISKCDCCELIPSLL